MADYTLKTLEINAPIEQIFAVAMDVSSYPLWAKGIRSIEVLETDEDGHPARVRFEVDGIFRQIQYTLNYQTDPPHRLAWKAEPGPDIAEMEGSYTLESLGEDRTKVIYALRAVPRFKIPGFLRQEAEKRVVGTALRGLRDRVLELEPETVDGS